MNCIDINPWQIEFSYEQAVSNALEAMQDRYNLGGITELNPNTPTDFYDGDGSQQRIDALCMACNLYVKSYAMNWTATAKRMLGDSIITTLVLSSASAIIPALLQAGISYINAIAVQAMDDEQALEAVICCMKDALTGADVTQQNFIQSLDNCNFAPSNEEIVRSILASDLGLFKNWLSFLDSLGNSFVLAENGVTDCPCVATRTIVVTFDQLQSNDFSVYALPPSLATIVENYELQSIQQGNPTPSAKMAYGTFGDGKEGFTTTIRVDLLASYNVSNASFEYFFYRYGTSNVVNRTLTLRDNQLNVVSQLQSSANDGIQSTWTVWGGTLAGQNVRYIDCLMALSLNPPSPTPANTMAWIDNITFTKETA